MPIDSQRFLAVLNTAALAVRELGGNRRMILRAIAEVRTGTLTPNEALNMIEQTILTTDISPDAIAHLGAESAHFSKNLYKIERNRQRNAEHRARKRAGLPARHNTTYDTQSAGVRREAAQAEVLRVQSTLPEARPLGLPSFGLDQADALARGEVPTLGDLEGL